VPTNVAAAPALAQSGVIPWRRNGGEFQVLLITARKSREWIVPKGSVEPHLPPAVSAAKEAWEEAGVIGHVGTRELGAFYDVKRGCRCRVAVYPLAATELLDDWPETDRERRWASVEEARELVADADLQALIDALPRWVGR